MSSQDGADKIDIESKKLEFEREKWRDEFSLRQRDIAVKEREQEHRGAELQLKRDEQAASKWRNPLVVAIFAAAVAALGNAVVTVVNGILQRQLEDKKHIAELRVEESKAESTRILEMIKTGDPEKAANNLAFLLDTGLVTGAERGGELRKYLANRKPGSGPSLPAAIGRYTFEPTESLTPAVKQNIERNLRSYIDYLQGLGLRTDLAELKIKIEKIESGVGSVYSPENQTFTIDPKSADNIYFVILSYTAHIVGAMLTPTGSTPQEVWGFVYYLVCSYLDGRSSLPTTAVSDCDIVKQRADGGGENRPVGMARALWEMRERVGQSLSDQIIGRALLSLKISDMDESAALAALANSLLSATTSIDAKRLGAVRDVLQRHKLSVPSVPQ